MRIHHDSVSNRQKPPFEGGHGTSGKGARSAGEDDQRDRLSIGGRGGGEEAEPRVPTGGMSALRSGKG